MSANDPKRTSAMLGIGTLAGPPLLPPEVTVRATVASICKHIVTKARTDDVWSAIRDIGALHTRLVPGFVTDTRLERGARIVTFGNGMVLREPIIAVEEGSATRLVCRGCTVHTLQCVTSSLRRGRRRLARD